MTPEFDDNSLINTIATISFTMGGIMRWVCYFEVLSVNSMWYDISILCAGGKCKQHSFLAGSKGQ